MAAEHIGHSGRHVMVSYPVADSSKIVMNMTTDCLGTDKHK